ncbi:MAG: lipopolysaccharide export system outer membrane lipoprotein component LptE [Idiomarinaceae bacterium HL-53]|nr:MAG: lipopolysaccharide export system outer membrane lipoprotein component LptE [Idiomarinaceae bacterium HL-53]CUS48760.1 LPS-assembly lipoprotein [Idiomarinaceae bacterium HL-53]
MYRVNYSTLLRFNRITRVQGKFFALLLCCLVLSSCGFQLRGNFQLPDHIDSVIVLSDEESEVAKILRDSLEERGVRVVDSGDEYPIVRVDQDRMDRRILSLLPTGQVAEYELIYSLPVTFINSNGRETEQLIQLTRDYQDDPNFALAKMRELEIVVDEMRQEVVLRTLILFNQYVRD